MPGIDHADQRRHPEQLVEVGLAARPRRPGYCSLTATSRPSFQIPRCTCPMLAAAAAVSSNSLNRRCHPVPNCCGHQPVHGRGRHRRRGVLQLGQRLAVRRRVLVGDRGLVDAQRLAELHRPALERAEHLEQLLGRAALQFGGDLVAVPPDQSLTRARGWPARPRTGAGLPGAPFGSARPAGCLPPGHCDKGAAGQPASRGGAPVCTIAPDPAAGRRSRSRGSHTRDGPSRSGGAAPDRRPAIPGCR